MFETIFTLCAAHKHRLAPLLREREEFLAYLQSRGMSRGCLRNYASRLNQIIRFLKLKRMRPVRPREIAIAARQWAKYQGEFRSSRVMRLAMERDRRTPSRRRVMLECLSPRRVIPAHAES